MIPSVAGCTTGSLCPVGCPYGGAKFRASTKPNFVLGGNGNSKWPADSVSKDIMYIKAHNHGRRET